MGPFLFAYALLALSTGMNPIFSAAMKEVNPAEAVGSSIGIANGVCYLFVALVSNAAGYVMDLYRADAVAVPGALIYSSATYQTIFLGCAALAGTAFLASWFIPETGPEPVRE